MTTSWNSSCSWCYDDPLRIVVLMTTPTGER